MKNDPFETIDPKQCSPAIIVACLHGHWAAWWEGEPHVAWGGATPAEAVDRLHAADPEKISGLEEVW